MSASEYLLAVVLLTAAVGGAALAGLALRVRFLPAWAGAQARLAEAVLALLVLLGCAQALGVAGLLNRPALVAVLLIAGAAGAARRPWQADAAADQPPRLDALTVGACAVGCLAVTVVWLRRSLLALDVGMGGTDTLWFHMPFAAAFADSGSITSLLHTDTEFANAFYPANSELLHATGIVLLGADVLSPVLNLAWLALLLLATWCIGRDRGIAPLTCLAGAALAALPTLAATQPGDAKNDVLALACIAASIVFMRARGNDTPAIALSGLAAGVAVGTKLSFALPALLLLGVAVAAASPGGRRARAAVWAGAAAVPSLAWFARNLVATGNPLPYVRDLGPVVLPGPGPAPQADAEFSVAHYLGEDGLWDGFFSPGLELAFGPAWWLVLGIAAAGLAAAARAGDRFDRILALAGLGAAVAYLFTPQTAAGPEGAPVGFGINLRYLTPALLIALVLLPCLPALRGRAGRLAAVAALAVVIAAGLASDGAFPVGYRTGAILAALALVAGAAGLALGLTRRRRRLVTLSAAAAACLAVAALGYPTGRDYLRQAYTRPSPPFTAWDAFSMNRAFAWAKGVSGARIGIVGMSGAFWQYPFAGDGDENTVRYVGTRGGAGSFEAISTCRAWRRELQRGGYDFVVTTPRLDPWRPFAGGPSPESRWTRGDPAAHEIVAQGPVRVYALSRPMSPEDCS